MKLCPKCETHKQPSEFFKDSKARDGLQCWCKACHTTNPKRDPDVNRRASRAWKAKHQERNRQLANEWAKNNPVRNAVKSARHKARLLGSEGDYTAQQWQALCERYGNKCLACGKPGTYETLTVDHVVPVSKGGSNTIDNIQPLCGPCNSGKRDRTKDYRSSV